MGYALHRIPEQPTQPPELPHDVELAYWSIYRETHKHEAAAAHFVVRRILSAGEGQLDSVTEYGAYVAFDAGDIWDALTESEESADLSILVGAVIAAGVPNVVARAQAFLNPLIDRFVDTHANNMAKYAATQYLLERGTQ